MTRPKLAALPVSHIIYILSLFQTVFVVRCLFYCEFDLVYAFLKSEGYHLPAVCTKFTYRYGK